MGASKTIKFEDMKSYLTKMINNWKVIYLISPHIGQNQKQLTF